MKGNVLIGIFYAFFAVLAFSARAESVKFEKTPALSGKSLLFVVRKQYPYEHHNTETMFQLGEIAERHFKKCAGGSMLVRADFDAEGNCAKQTAIFSAPEGVIRDASASFDGSRAVFSARESYDGSYKIYEADLKSGTVKRLTNLRDVSDIDPVYLPTGEIVFASTRAQKYCACNRHIMANLYRMNADGTNITQIGNSIEFENGPSVMRDGRILYTRWEYVDRNFGGAQGLWTANPDGTRHALYWGQSTNTAVLDSAQLPDGRVVAVFSSCHDKPWGALAVIDRTVDIEGEKSVAKIIPESARAKIGKGIDSMKSVSVKYEDPEPLSNSLVLASRQRSGGSDTMDLYLVNIADSSEKRVASADGEGFGIFDAKILCERPVPSALPEQREYSGDSALMYISDVYEGTHMKGVKRGDIKFIRVVEDSPKLNWSGGNWTAQGAQAPAMNYDDFDNKTVLGIVPVRDDGSAYFKIPSDKFIYLQVLDKDKKMLQSMRSGISAMPAEIVSCAGCHESRMSPPSTGLKPSAAIKSPPEKIVKTPASGKMFSYVKTIQPILDRHCVSCHDYGLSGADKIILSGDRGLVFNKSYTELWSKGHIAAIGAGKDEIYEANTWGAKKSNLVHLIDEGHSDVSLSAEEYGTICEWIDINAPYYDTGDSNYGNNPSGRSPLTKEELFGLLKLCGRKGLNPAYFKEDKPSGDVAKTAYPVEIISFDRPAVSEILAGANAADRAKAVEIIKLGGQRLRDKPREDMDGCGRTQKAKMRCVKSEKLWELELKNRAAIADGKKNADPETL